MQVPIRKDLVSICKEITAERKSVAQWSEIESSDMFQSAEYVGGFDADEEAFCFSYFDSVQEYWFQFSLKEASLLADGKIVDIAMIPAESATSENPEAG